ncbi:hypothetical protein MP228_003626 [Amoeboaphelidium protococcarum]|nr:hypothetical protein MP228_003626 [Amoeboaphelidium protococcarum]
MTLHQQLKEDHDVILLDDFICQELEDSILNFAQQLSSQWQQVKDRKVCHFGYGYNYGNFSVFKVDQDLPEFAHHILRRLEEFDASFHSFNQMTIQQYPIKAGLTPHIDSEEYFGNEIVIVSLGSHLIMDFHPVDTKANMEEVNVPLKRRSLLLMRNKLRYNYKHGFRERSSDLIDGERIKREIRTSLTFRKVIKYDNNNDSNK